MKSIAKDYPTTLGNPIDSTAKRVTSKGFQYTPSKILNGEHWDICPQTQPGPDNVPNLTGQRQGRLVIIGYYDRKTQPNGNHKHIWIVRCDCGKFETRIGATWTKYRAFNDACAICLHNWFLKHRHLTNDERDKILARMRLEHEEKMKVYRQI